MIIQATIELNDMAKLAGALMKGIPASSTYSVSNPDVSPIQCPLTEMVADHSRAITEIETLLDSLIKRRNNGTLWQLQEQNQNYSGNSRKAKSMPI